MGREVAITLCQLCTVYIIDRRVEEITDSEANAIKPDLVVQLVPRGPKGDTKGTGGMRSN